MQVVYLTYFQRDFFINLFCKTRKVSFSLGIEVVGEAVSATIVDSDTEGSTQKQQFPECLPALFHLQCSSLEHGPAQDALFGILAVTGLSITILHEP